MVSPATDLNIVSGTTFSRVLRWESSPFISKAITNITAAFPAVITATAHGLIDGWRAAVLSAGGMRQINAKQMPLRSTDFHPVTYIDVNTISFNDVDSAEYTAYTSGGALVYYTPVSLAGASAAMDIRLTPETADPPIVALSSSGPSPAITIDDTAKTITITIPAVTTATYPALFLAAAQAAVSSTGVTLNPAGTYQGVYDLLLTDSAGGVTRLLHGAVNIIQDVTYT
ncbi:MAG: hypothetical protein ACYDBH_00480 [Acidobacteriaceae bacterium]